MLRQLDLAEFVDGCEEVTDLFIKAFKSNAEVLTIDLTGLKEDCRRLRIIAPHKDYCVAEVLDDQPGYHRGKAKGQIAHPYSSSIGYQFFSNE